MIITTVENIFRISSAGNVNSPYLYIEFKQTSVIKLLAIINEL